MSKRDKLPKNNKKNKDLPTSAPQVLRSTAEITKEYNFHCTNLGNALIQFGLIAIPAFNAYSQLNQEMLAAEERESAERQAKADAMDAAIAEQDAADDLGEGCKLCEADLAEETV